MSDTLVVVILQAPVPEPDTGLLTPEEEAGRLRNQMRARGESFDSQRLLMGLFECPGTSTSSLRLDVISACRYIARVLHFTRDSELES